MPELSVVMEEYKQRLYKLRLMSDSINRRTKLYSNISDIDDKRAAKSMTALRKASNPGGKLQKIGFIIFWFPEPTFITHAIGGPMILAGRYLEKKYNGATLNDVGKVTKDNRQIISSFKDEVL
jgi:hypothetical protein